VVDKVPHGHWKTQTFLAALRCDRVEAPCLFDGPINGERFLAYVEQFLVPALKPDDIVLADNLGSHKAKPFAGRSRPSARAFSSCPSTRPTSIRSSRSSPN
jgi:putative transposase